jgi:hypothetical protein
MGYRGKLAERQQARQLRRAGLPLAEIAARLGVSKSSVSLWVRDVEFEPRAGPSRGRRRAPNALQRRRQAEIDRLVEEGRARIGRLSDREFLVAGSRCTRGRAARGWSPPLRQQRSPHDRVLLLLVTTVLRGRRVAVAGPPLPPRRPGSGRRHRLLVGADRDPPSQFGKPYRAVPDPSIRHAKHVHGCLTVSYSCSATHRSVMGLVSALLSNGAIPG